MIETDRLVAYLASFSIHALTPGPEILYVMTRTIAGGFAHVLAAALGLSAILATSAHAFQAVKYVGAAYLVYLGIQMIRRSGRLEVADAPPPTAIFFLSFIPSFVSKSSFAQFVFLGALSVTLNTLARKLTGTWPRRQQLATGTGMVTMGIYAAAD